MIQSGRRFGDVVLISTLLLAGGCSGESDSALARTLDDVHNGPVALESCPLQFVEAWTLGSADAEHGPAFGGIVSYAVDDDGTVYVADNIERTVHVIDSSGVRRRVIGRAGEGPGEFSLPYRVAAAGGRVTVYDRALNRLTRFDSTGALLHTAVVPTAFTGEVRIRSEAAGGVWMVGSAAGISGVIHQLDAEFGLVRSIGQPRTKVPPGDRPWLSWGSIAMDGSTVWFAPVAEAVIERYSRAGELQQTITRENEWNFFPRPYQQTSRLEDGRVASGFDVDRPMGTGLTLDKWGYLWRLVRDNPRGRMVVDVFDSDGRFIHSSEWALDEGPAGMDAHRNFYLIRRDAGYPQLTRFNVTNLARGGRRICAD